MAYRYVQPKFPSKQAYSTWPSKTTLFNGGLDLVTPEYKLPDSKTNKCLNVWYRDGEIEKRWGQDYILDTEVVESVCYAAYEFLYLGFIIKHSGTKLYKQNVTTGVSTEIYTGLSTVRGVFFKFNQNLYYLQAGKYIVWDGATTSVVDGYIPNVILNRTAAGGGDVDEQYNRIQPGFKNSFATNGVDTVYPLTDQDLDATSLIGSDDGGVTFSLVEGVEFTVNRTTGVVTFAVAPIVGTNLYRIQAYKTVQEDIDSILECTAAIPFGGQNDNRIFFGANGTGKYFWSGISSLGVDATYFPFDNFNIVANVDEPIYGFGRHYDVLVVLKQRDLMAVTYTFDGVTGIFASYYINSQYGCDCPETIKTVNNNLVWLNSVEGVITLIGTLNDSQRNAFTCSRNIDPTLLKQDNLKTATAVDFDGKYWLCVNDTAYVWDYFISPYVDTYNPDKSAEQLSWWYFTNIDSASFIKNDNKLYYGSRVDGKTIFFDVTNTVSIFSDFGDGIPALYRYPMRQLGQGMREFTVLRGYVDVRGDSVTNHKVEYFTSDEPFGEPKTETIVVGSFSWFPFSWAAFTWGVTGPLFSAVLTPFLKNIQWFAVEFSNSENGKSMNMSAMSFQYQITRIIR